MECAVKTFPSLSPVVLAAVLLFSLAGVQPVAAEDTAEAAKPVEAPKADEASKPAEAPKHMDVKGTFRNICGFCHADYGRKAGKGPQLMNSERTDDFLFNRIKKGMPSRMAAFGSVYSDDQIHDIVKFIRNLKDGEEPQNP